MATTSQRWTSRSTRVTTEVALGKTSFHSAKVASAPERAQLLPGARSLGLGRSAPQHPVVGRGLRRLSA
jgi:hypothetical protein